MNTYACSPQSCLWLLIVIIRLEIRIRHLHPGRQLRDLLDGLGRSRRRRRQVRRRYQGVVGIGGDILGGGLGGEPALLLALDLGEGVADVALLDVLVLVAEGDADADGELAEAALGLAVHDHEPADAVLLDLSELGRDGGSRLPREGLVVVLGALHHHVPLVVVREGLLLHRLEAHRAARLSRAGVADPPAVRRVALAALGAAEVVPSVVAVGVPVERGDDDDGVALGAREGLDVGDEGVRRRVQTVLGRGEEGHLEVGSFGLLLLL